MRIPKLAAGHPLTTRNRRSADPFPPLTLITRTSATTNLSSGTNDYGAWGQLIASTAVNSYGLRLVNQTGTTALSVSGASHPCLLDIGIGGSGSEVVIIGGLDISNRNSGVGIGIHIVDIPYLFIPVGSRIAARISSSSSSRQLSLNASPYTAEPGIVVPKRKADQLVTPSSQRGVSVAVSSSWTQIVSTTPRPYWGLVFSAGADSNTGTGAVAFLEIATGAAGSEVALTGWTIFQNTSEGTFVGESLFTPRYVPPGTRIAGRITGTGTATSVTVHGLY